MEEYKSLLFPVKDILNENRFQKSLKAESCTQASYLAMYEIYRPSGKNTKYDLVIATS